MGQDCINHPPPTQKYVNERPIRKMSFIHEDEYEHVVETDALSVYTIIETSEDYSDSCIGASS